ncbi:hypothetical protein BBOV_I003510 [Babesia bovis T2Bo]|uniref:Uncharacterized protein n=1 Tax=Babesia bovis TaxID=5865 RepID=A7AWK5_BABBO|nr:hypothetical protein BBOV_I003510 [Babesia bovis T2Bo]EDO05433.1 hypothetical protein BBOV_I003510 [Babesia bovis T2Bo]|eukprot:XP_001609001.1 hypothetical protein [Babesia bovis T2Bo]
MDSKSNPLGNPTANRKPKVSGVSNMSHMGYKGSPISSKPQVNETQGHTFTKSATMNRHPVDINLAKKRIMPVNAESKATPPKRPNVQDTSKPMFKHFVPPSPNTATGNVPMELPQPTPEEASPPPIPDMSKLDTKKLLSRLVDVTKITSTPSGESLESRLQFFGYTIADILMRNADIVECCRLTGESTETADVDQTKLRLMTNASQAFFSDMVELSDQMHEMINNLPPFYTRTTPFFRNLEIQSGDFTSYSHTHLPQAAVSKQLVRLQSEFLQNYKPKSQ